MYYKNLRNMQFSYPKSLSLRDYSRFMKMRGVDRRDYLDNRYMYR
jgi:hypothetical protein